MKAIKKSLPVLLMILFEIVVGALLLIDAKKFTTVMFIAFGCVLMLAAFVILLRYLQDRKNEEEKPLTLAAAILFFIIGALFAFGATALAEAYTTLTAIFYGAVLIVSGFFKISEFVSLKKAKSAVSKIRIFAGAGAIVLGVVAIFNPFEAFEVLATILGIALIVEAVLDIAALVMARQISRQMMIEAEAYGSRNDIDDDD